MKVGKEMIVNRSETLTCGLHHGSTQHLISRSCVLFRPQIIQQRANMFIYWVCPHAAPQRSTEKWVFFPSNHPRLHKKKKKKIRPHSPSPIWLWINSLVKASCHVQTVYTKEHELIHCFSIQSGVIKSHKFSNGKVALNGSCDFKQSCSSAPRFPEQMLHVLFLRSKFNTDEEIIT